MIALVLLGMGTLVCLGSLRFAGPARDRRAGWLAVGLTVLLVAGSGLATALGSHLTGRPHAAFVVVGLVVAAVAGGQVATATFEAIDERDEGAEGEKGAEGEEGQKGDAATGPGGFDPPADRAHEEGLRSAGLVLRGGAWIGALERLAVFAALVARWPEGIAVVLAVKGLGRYPELRSGRSPGLAERFIIGTLVSVLWAALCAYAATGPALG